MNLYELKENYLRVLEIIESGYEAEWLDDTLEAINDSIEVKADGYAKIIRSLEGSVSALKTEIDRLTNRKKSIENNIDRLKENLKKAMIETGKEKIKTDLFNITVANNPPSVKVVNEDLIPNTYFNIKEVKTLDKIKIRDLLKAGNEIEGVELTQGKGLRIK